MPTIVRAHTWVVEYVDAGMLDGHFWKCSACDASGGPASFGSTGPAWEPFYADGSGLKVSHDCDEAKAQVAAHVATWVPPDRRHVRPATPATVGPVQPGLTPEDLARFEASAHEMADLGYQLWGAKHDHLDPDRMGSFRAHCDAERERIETQQPREAEVRRLTHEEWLVAGGTHDGG